MSSPIEKINGVTERLAENAWLKVTERAAIYVTVVIVSIGVYQINKLYDIVTDPGSGLTAKVTEVRTVQNKAIVPRLETLTTNITIVTDNLLNHPRFDKIDAQRMDDKHRKIMNDLDIRIRQLESEP